MNESDCVAYDTRPPEVAPDSKLLSPRNGHRGLLPSTWLNCEVRLEYVDASGKAAATSGVLLDWFPFGPALNLAGAKSVIGWDRIVLVEFASD